MPFHDIAYRTENLGVAMAGIRLRKLGLGYLLSDDVNFYVVILKTKDLAQGDPENKGLTENDLENKGFSGKCFLLASKSAFKKVVTDCCSSLILLSFQESANFPLH